MKNFSNYDKITERMIEFTDKAPAHLRGRKIPVLCSKGGLHFDSRIDLTTLIAYEITDAEYKNVVDLPTINDLIKNGIANEWLPYKDVSLCNIDKKTEFFDEGQLRIEAIKEYFKNNGLIVSTGAIMHNYEAWKCDYKSGYRDEVNNCHVFSPCGCNPFALHVSELYADCDWQTTYIC